MSSGRRASTTTLCLAAAACAALAAPGPAAASEQGWQTAADVGEAGLVALALGVSVAQDDWRGAGQLGLSLGAVTATTQGLKHAIPETRPSGANRRSFPSGHTSTSFAAAGYLQQRYGWKWGLPAALAAGLVGVSRVQSHDHYWHDVVVGAALGELSAFLFTSPHDSSVKVLPWADAHAGGVMVAARF